MNLPDGSLRLNIIEAKAWSSRKVLAKNLSAFGLAKVDTTVNRNIDALKLYIQRDVDNLTPTQINLLTQQLDNLDFDVTLTGLNGLTEYADNVEDILKTRVLNRNGPPGIKGKVNFFNTNVNRE